MRDWHHEAQGRPRYVRAAPVLCPRCWRPTRPVAFTPEDYAELLGLYLGDGCISQHPRTQRLRITLDARYPMVIDEAEALLRRCLPKAAVGRIAGNTARTWTVVSAYHAHLACLLPEHGPGKKHHRSVALGPWQQELVDLAPWALLRGLIRSDGCVFVNRTGPYAYLSYDFCNSSADIRALFAATCTAVGVECRVAGMRIRINRRASVALMERHVGTKIAPEAVV